MRFFICLLASIPISSRVFAQQTDTTKSAGGVRAPLKAVYVYAYRNQKNTAKRISRLLEPRRIETTIVHAVDLDESLFVDTDLVIIGFETRDVWGTELAVDEIRETSLPVLALGEGGHRLLGALDLKLGDFPSERGKGTAVRPSPDAIFWDGFRSEPVDGLHQCFTESSKVSVRIPENADNVYPIAADPAQSGHYLIAAEKPYYLFLGFEGRPEQLTDVGRNLLPWACYYAVAMKRNPERAFASNDEVSKISRPSSSK